MKTIIGIDLGKHGAIAVSDMDGVKTYPMPMIKNQIDYTILYEIIHRTSFSYQGFVVFERLGVIFGTSKKTAFEMGYQSGAMEMICIALSMPYRMVSPKEWQKVMFKDIPRVNKPGMTSLDTKAMALIKVKQLYPKLQLTFGKGVKPHDGLIDAVLLTDYIRNTTSKN